MRGHEVRSSAALTWRTLFAVILLAMLAALLATANRAPRAAFTSAEVEFTDASAHGLAIVPASCPSSPDYAGQCSTTGTCPDGSPVPSSGECPPSGAPYVCINNQCVAPMITFPGETTYGSYTSCAAACNPATPPTTSPTPPSSPPPPPPPSCTPSTTCKNSTTVRVVRDNCSVTDTSCPAGWSCGGGACHAPESIGFASFTAYGPADDSGFRATFTATGQLEVRPLLVRQGDTVQVYWNVTNATGCSVTSTNGDRWTGNFSGSYGKTSKGLPGETTYSLHCDAYLGATPPDLNQTIKVNVVPVFQEN